MLVSCGVHLPTLILCSSLLVISTSLALGLILGFAIVQSYTLIFGYLANSCNNEGDEKIALRKRRQDMMKGMYTAQISPDDDPSSLHVPEPEKEDGIAAILSEELF